MVDVVFEWPAREVLALVEGLPDHKVFAAYLHGGAKWREFLGWGKTRHMVADQWDLHVAINTPKGKKAQAYPRPSKRTEASTAGVPLFSMRPRVSKGD